MKVEYPKWVYKPDGSGVIVKDEQEHEQRKAEGYGPHPSTVKDEPEAQAEVSEDAVNQPEDETVEELVEKPKKKRGRPKKEAE